MRNHSNGICCTGYYDYCMYSSYNYCHVFLLHEMQTYMYYIQILLSIFTTSCIIHTSGCTDLFVEVTNVTKGNGIWAHFASTGCFPSQIQLSRPIQKDDVEIETIYFPSQIQMLRPIQKEDVQIETICCIFKHIRINWLSINVTGISGTMITIPYIAYVSIGFCYKCCIYIHK